MEDNSATDGVRILGVDPGLRITGYGVLVAVERQLKLHEAGIVRGGTKAPLASRLRMIHEGIVEVIQACRPAALALEELYSHYKHPRTAILMGHARGVICLAAAEMDVPVIGYTATRVKKILTGSGRAPKVQVQQAVQRELGLPSVPDPPDIADALALAMCHWHQESAANNVSF